MSVEIAVPLFWARLRRVIDHWRGAPGLFGGAPVMCIAIGKDDEDRPDNLRITTVQNYLFGYEFPETVLLFTAQRLEVWSSQRRCEVISQVHQGKPADFDYQVETTVISYKAEEDNRRRFDEFLAQNAGPLGLLVKETKYQKGTFSKALLDRIAATATIQAVDVASGWAEVLSVKDEVEIGHVRRSATFTCSVYKKFTVAEIEKIIDSNKETPQSRLAQDTEAVILHPRKKFSSVGEEFAQAVDTCYVPVVQSGGKFDLPALYTCRAETSDDNLTFDTIVIGIGTKYKQYCSTVARTLMIDTPPQQAQAYHVLEAAHRQLLQTLKPGITFADVYRAVADSVAAQATAEEFLKQLPERLLDRLGYGIGLSVRDPFLEISPTNTRIIKANMTLVVMTGFQGVKVDHPDATRQTASMVIADTVLVVDKPREDSTYVEVLTKSPSAYQNVSYTLADEEGQEESDGSENPEDKAAKWKSTLRHNKGATQSNAAAREKQRQRVLEQKRQASTQRRRTQQEEKKDFTSAGRLARGQLSSYATEKEIPEVRGLYLDKNQDTLLIPLWGASVPFHLCTIRNVTKSEEGDSVFLRFNFLTPSGGAQAYIPGTMFPTATFIKEITYRVHARQASKADGILTEVMAAIKRIKAFDVRKKEEEGMVRQEVLHIDRNVAAPKLRDVLVRPTKGRKQQGTLEGHRDGVRFIGRASDQLDILFSNVKHGIIHPAKNDVICLVHFHLKNPIMLGSKKTIDVQFYVEVMTDEKLQGNNMRRSSEEQEIEDENRQREQISRWNTEFLTWGQRMQSIATFRFDTPFYKSDFSGNVHRSVQTIRKTNHCLVSLVEGPPFFVLTLEDVEICVLERVILGHKNFDMVFVNKDYKLGVTRIDTVDMQRLDEMKDWLTSVQIVYFEVPQPLAWAPIMREVMLADSQEDWEPWSEQNGWASFLDINQVDSDDSETDSEDSAFDAAHVSEESADSSFSEDSAEEESSGGDEDEEEESGTDWDEMEDRLGKEDRQQNVSASDSDDSEDGDAPKRKKPASKPAAGKGKGGPPRPTSGPGPRPGLGGPRPAATGARPPARPTPRPSPSAQPPAKRPHL